MFLLENLEVDTGLDCLRNNVVEHCHENRDVGPRIQKNTKKFHIRTKEHILCCISTVATVLEESFQIVVADHGIAEIDPGGVANTVDRFTISS